MASDHSERLKNLSPSQREKLLKAIQAKQTTTEKTNFIPRISREEPAPLSFSQQRMWFLQQWDLGSPLYNISLALHLQGNLQRPLLTRCLEEIVQRHEILRTTFPLLDGLPVQMIHAPAPLALALIDLREQSPVQQQTLLTSLLTAAARQAFDLQQGPLLRLLLLQLAADEHVLLLTIHHIVTDGWSMQIFLDEVSQLYQAFSLGLPSPLPPLPLQYADYAHWQREWLQGEVLERQLGYWKNQLVELPALELPLDHPRPAVLSFEGASFSFALPQTLLQQLQRLSQQEGVTLFVVLLTAFQVLLARYSHQQDIVLGTPVANRKRKELEKLIGCFTNTLVLRTDLSGNPTFREALHRVREVCLDAYTHQDLPFERLVEALQPERDPSRNPLFQVLFALQNEPASQVELRGLVLDELATQNTIARLDLSLNMTELPQGLVGEIEYSTSLFSAEAIANLFKRYRSLLTGVQAHPEQPIQEIPFLTEEEKQRFMQWNATEADYPQHAGLHELFEAQAMHAPEAIAITLGEQQVTYGYVNEFSNRLASYLQNLGAGPEILVGICLERSLEMVLALLGVLKAGSAYVPLDPGYPQERLTFILNDARTPILLTHGQWQEQFLPPQIHVILWDTHFKHLIDTLPLVQTHEESFSRSVLPGNLAYVAYTSGSTGKPKGVAVSHASIVNRLLWGQSALPLSRADRVLQIAPLSFDISIWEIFGPLFVGGRLTLAQAGGHYDPGYLVELMAEQQVTVAHFVPATLRMLLENVSLQEKSALRALFCGGDVVPVDLRESVVARLNVAFHQFYGPTEAAINSTYWVYQSERKRRNAPIGRPIANTQIYLLDAYLQPVPVGTSGEIYIGGSGVARGYWNQSHLTAERFIPHPFSSHPGERLYKTGDIACYQPDGDLEFLGRIDAQVKIRGHRIEPGEIEIALSGHPAIREVVVLPREDTPERKRLVAYIVLQANHPSAPSEVFSPDSRYPHRELPFHQHPLSGTAPLNREDNDFLQLTSEFRTYLVDRLPGYMVPAAFIILDSLPLNPNGKVDRQALPLPENMSSKQRKISALPRTDRERALSDIFQHVLHISQVSIYDNFFELGGHSLLATQAISAIRQTFKLELPLRAFFEKPTIAELAVLIAESEKENASPLSIIEHLPRGNAAQLIARLPQLSDEDIDALLAERLLKGDQ